ncbi:MAG: DoxX family protein [Verrucomicrobiae bacterium]|nr:DoxX family protein [Verrucomicrobiae bacterium]MCP5540802.1 DoxX family protein [Akkermansiaceae bacterium]MCP5551294.1 DoxX family protein [Akkermansiaceae bacterium]
MAFLTPSTSSSSADAPRAGLGLADFTLGWLRLAAAVPMFYYQSWSQAQKAWRFVWSQEAWPLAEKVTEMGLPQPPVFAVTLIFLLTVCPFGLLIGFLTRVNAVITCVALGFVFMTGLIVSPWLNAQTLLLYMGVAVALAIGGPGLFSMDALFAWARRRRKMKKQRA